MKRTLIATALCATALPAAAAAMPAPAAPVAKVQAPRSGTFSGTHKLIMSISGRSIELAAFDFRCHATSGRTNLNAIPLKKTSKGFTFSIKAHGSVTYADEHPDQNGAISFRGRFSRTGRSARGVLRVKTAHCGDSGDVSFRAHR